MITALRQCGIMLFIAFDSIAIFIASLRPFNHWCKLVNKTAVRGSVEAKESFVVKFQQLYVVLHSLMSRLLLCVDFIWIWVRKMTSCIFGHAPVQMGLGSPSKMWQSLVTIGQATSSASIAGGRPGRSALWGASVKPPEITCQSFTVPDDTLYTTAESPQIDLQRIIVVHSKHNIASHYKQRICLTAS